MFDVRYSERTTEWGHWGITFMDPQPDRTKNYGVIVGRLSFGVGNAGPCDGTLGSPIRERYKAICRAWINHREIPDGFVVG